MKTLILLLFATAFGFAMGAGYPDKPPWDILSAIREAITTKPRPPAPDGFTPYGNGEGLDGHYGQGPANSNEPDRFAAALDFTLGNEGGYSDHPADSGGKTWRGITAKTAQTYCNTSDPRELSDEQIKTIYQTGYWQESGAPALPPPLDLVAFDIAVKEGPGVAQDFLADAAYGTPEERAEILITRFEDRLRQKIRKNPKLKTFEKGWMARITRLRTHITQSQTSETCLPRP